MTMQKQYQHKLSILASEKISENIDGILDDTLRFKEQDRLKCNLCF